MYCSSAASGGVPSAREPAGAGGGGEVEAGQVGRRLDPAEAQRRRHHVDGADRRVLLVRHRVVPVRRSADDQRHVHAARVRRALAEVTVGTVLVAVVGEVDHGGVAGEAEPVQRVADAADVVVEVLDEGARAGDLAAGLRLDPRDRGHVPRENHVRRPVPAHPLGRRGVRIVRRLNREDDEERLALGRERLEVFDREVGQVVGLERRQPVLLHLLGPVSRPPVPMDVAVELRVVVLVADPRVEAAPPLARHVVERGAAVALVEPVEVPLAEPGRVPAGVAERVRDRWHLRRQPHLVAVHAVVRVPPRQQRAPRRAAQREHAVRRVKRTPSAASRSRCGVTALGSPAQESIDPACWSDRIQMALRAVTGEGASGIEDAEPTRPTCRRGRGIQRWPHRAASPPLIRSVQPLDASGRSRTCVKPWETRDATALWAGADAGEQARSRVRGAGARGGRDDLALLHE